MNATFTVSSYGTFPVHYRWVFNGAFVPGATNASLVLTNVQLTNAGTYSIQLSNSAGTATTNVALVLGTIARWGVSDNCAPCRVPLDLTNAVAVSGWNNHYLALKPDRTIRAWGDNISGQTNAPGGLTNVIGISTSDATSLALQSDGTVIGWGAGLTYTDFPHVGQRMFPPDLTNVVALASGAWHCMALKGNGAVAAWGYNGHGQANVHSDATNVTALAGGWGHSLALRTDGRVIAWGAGFTNGPFPHFGQCAVPSDLSNVVAIAANGYHSLALKSDGTVVAWGAGLTNFGSFPHFGQSIVPAGLSNVVGIAAGFFNCMALKRDGKIVTWGLLTPPDAGLGGVTAVEGTANGGIALRSSSSPFIVSSPLSQTVPSGSQVLFSAVASGAHPLNFQWQFNGTNLTTATNSFLILTNVPLAASGHYQCVVTNWSGSSTSSVASLDVTRRPLPAFAPTNLHLTSGGFQMELNGLAGSGPVVLFASSNCLDWESIFTNPPLVGSWIYLDSKATNWPVRFYKAVELSN